MLCGCLQGSGVFGVRLIEGGGAGADAAACLMWVLLMRLEMQAGRSGALGHALVGPEAQETAAMWTDHLRTHAHNLFKKTLVEGASQKHRECFQKYRAGRHSWTVHSTRQSRTGHLRRHSWQVPFRSTEQ
eukprot:1157097-Pelagomonas_calceolata.AAC.12